MTFGFDGKWQEKFDDQDDAVTWGPGSGGDRPHG
jgi:hypothetical protein